MSLLYDPQPFAKASKQQALDTLATNMLPYGDVHLLLIGAVLLTIGGIFLGSAPVLIASMLVAPLAYPILGLGLRIASKDKWLMLQVQALAILASAFSKETSWLLIYPESSKPDIGL